MKDFLKKALPILIFAPVLLIELAFLGKTAVNLSSGTIFPGSPDSEIATILGANTNTQLSVIIDRLLLAAIAVVVFGLVFLWLKFGSKDYYK